ncbi:MAG TPA: hypothetical protein PKZ32_20480 [Candidatus Melainabacteria bacterium]|nr:hypothetical protein [Candidatus Melainabacteria bacterium]
MQIRLNRATIGIVVSLLVLCLWTTSSVQADEALRIARPQRNASPVQAPSTDRAASSETVDSQSVEEKKMEAGGSCCGSSDGPTPSESVSLSSALPPEGLYTHWRNEFVNPTMCPVRLCHGSCAKTSLGCKNIKTMIDSLLDAYIPEEQPIEAVLNFRCCAGFSDD